MAQRPAHVPQFGNWDATDQVPFTLLFDNTRAVKMGGKKFNPNDPAENPAAFGLIAEDVSPSEECDSVSPVPPKPHASLEAGLQVQSRHNGNEQESYKAVGTDASRRGPSASGARENVSDTDGSRKGPSATFARENVGLEESPNYQVYQGRLGNRPGSPYGERRNFSEGGNVNAPTPGKSRLRGSSRADETPDRSAALPKFGAWDENDPAAGEGFTIIFNQARNEKKQGGPVRIPTLQGESSAKLNYGDGHKQGQSSQYYKKKSSFWSCCTGSSTSE